MKKIIPKIEFLPNYLWHIFAISNLWDCENLEYSTKYKKMISDEDLNFLYDNRDLLAWGNGRGGVFSGLLFFIPLSFNYMKFEEYIEYINLLIESAASKDWNEFKEKYDFKYDMTDVVFSKTQIDYLKRYLIIIEKYYSDYLDKLWNTHNTLLSQTANYIIEYFNELNAIEKWESFLKKYFPSNEFNIILTVANKNLPSANNLSRTRYNFYYHPNNEKKLCKFILHEIGANLLGNDLHKNYKDNELKFNFINENNLIWQAFEALAEYIKSEIFNVEAEVWDGTIFGGGTYYFKDFFKFYNDYNWNKSNNNFSAIMKEAIYYVNKQRNIE